MPDALAGWSEDDAGGAEEVAAAVAAVAPLPLHRAATRRSSSSSRLLFVISDAVFSRGYLHSCEIKHVDGGDRMESSEGQRARERAALSREH
jgi:hypothetical protein